MSDMIYSDEVYAIQGAVFEVYNYLRGTKMKLGLLINFGHYPGVEIKRIAL